MSTIHQMSVPQLEVRDLRLVQAIRDERTTAAAARRLGLTQSAVSHQLRNLEERLELEVFVRRGRGLSITDAGERICDVAASVLGSLTAVEKDLRDGAARKTWELRVATQCYTAYHWLPLAMRRLQERHPDVRITIVPDVRDGLSSAIAEGSLDLALCIGKRADPALVQRSLFRDELVLAVSPEHPLASRSYVSGEDLVDEHVFLYSFAADRKGVKQHLFPQGGALTRVTRIPLTEAIVELVRANLGISILAGWAVEPYVARGELVCVRLGRRGLVRHWMGCYPKSSHLREPIACLLDTLVKMGSPALYDPRANPSARRSSRKS